jgi:hypothetical protein
MLWLFVLRLGLCLVGLPFVVRSLFCSSRVFVCFVDIPHKACSVPAANYCVLKKHSYFCFLITLKLLHEKSNALNISVKETSKMKNGILMWFATYCRTFCCASAYLGHEKLTLSQNCVFDNLKWFKNNYFYF